MKLAFYFLILDLKLFVNVSQSWLKDTFLAILNHRFIYFFYLLKLDFAHY
jgi:hypothetical protein